MHDALEFHRLPLFLIKNERKNEFPTVAGRCDYEEFMRPSSPGFGLFGVYDSLSLSHFGSLVAFQLPWTLPIEFYAILGANLLSKTHQNPSKIDARGHPSWASIFD